MRYYSFDKVLSFNAVYNMIVGGRGIGKTFGAKKKAIADAIKNGDQFIYLRRYDKELKASVLTFFSDVEHMFPNYDLRVNGKVAEYAHVETRDDKKREWRRMGFFMHLSTAQNQKSVAFPKVKTIIFDEFIIEKGAVHYLPNEAAAFNNFYLTVDRYKDKTRVMFLANSVSMMNPYFIEYAIVPEAGRELMKFAGGFGVAHFPESEAFQSDVYETRFGKFIKESDYAEYAVGNAFADNHEGLLGAKNSRSKYSYSLETKTGTFSVWYSYMTDEYFIQEKRPKAELLFTMLADRMSADKQLMRYTDKPMQYLRAAFNKARVTFDSAKTRNSFTEIFKR